EQFHDSYLTSGRRLQFSLYVLIHQTEPVRKGYSLVNNTHTVSRIRRSAKSRPSGRYHSAGVCAPPPCPPAPIEAACSPKDKGMLASVEEQSKRLRIPK